MIAVVILRAVINGRALHGRDLQAAADRLWAANPGWNSMLRTTCVVTRIDGGHADNALPQQARAHVNNAAGIPTYGLSGIFHDADGPRTHGLNERIRVKSLLDSRRFLHAIVRVYADAP